MPKRTVYLIDELWLDGDRVACRYAVAFVTAGSRRGRWHAIVYDPAQGPVVGTAGPVRFSAISRDGARLGGRVTSGKGEASAGAEYLAGAGPLSVRGQDRKPVVLGPAEEAARELAASTFIGGRLYPLQDTDPPPADGGPAWTGGRLVAAVKMTRPSATTTWVTLVALCALAVWGGVAAVFDIWHLMRDEPGDAAAVAAVSAAPGTTCLTATRVVIDGRTVPLRSALMILERPAAGDAHWTFVLFEPDAAVAKTLEGCVEVQVKTLSGLAYSGPAWVGHAGPGSAYVRLSTAGIGPAAGAAAVAPLR